jgi:glutamate racemase
LPYGDKSPTSIKAYSKKISEYLLSKNCKLIVIACNSASSIAYDTIRSHVGNTCPVIDVIRPVVKKVAKLKGVSKVGVIGTRATIRSGEYMKQLQEIDSSLDVASLTTPLLAPMIEEGFFNNKISRTIINSYLSKKKLSEIDVLILACTHYPLIMDEINEYYDNKVRIINSAAIVAKKVEETLKRRSLQSKRKSGSHHFYVSDFTKSFEQSTKIFFEGKIKLEKLDLWA